MKKKPKNYVSNKQLYEYIVEYNVRRKAAEAAGKPRPPMPDKVGEAIYLMCTRMGTRFNFRGYSFNDEMVGDAIVDCVNAFYLYDSDRFNNPFGYFSRIAWNAMIRKIFTEKVETYVKHKSLINAMISGDHWDSPDDFVDSRAIQASSAAETPLPGASGSVSDGVVTDFESLIERRKKARTKKSEETTEP